MRSSKVDASVPADRFFKGVCVDAIVAVGNKKASSLLGHFHQVYMKHLFPT